MKKKKIKIAIDSPAAAGAGTVAKKIAKHYKLLYLDTGKIYRFIGKNFLENKKKIKYKNLKNKIKKLKVSDLNNKNLLSDKIGVAASIIAKKKRIRKLVYNFQKKCAYHPPKRFNGSCLDGRDITYKIVPDADLKFFITANVKIRAKRRYIELLKLNYKIKFSDVLKSIKKRDKNDYNRKISRLKRTKDSILINTTNLSRKECFLKIRKIIDSKINGNL